MKKNNRDYRPGFRPVEHIQLPEINVKMRWIAIVVLLSIAVVAIGKGLAGLVNVEPGWNTIQVGSDAPNCSREFSLQYDFSDDGGAATVRQRKLTEVYTQAVEDAYRIFSAEEGGGVRLLNDHVNEAVTVEPALYQALSEFTEETAPYLFLAPAMVEYDRVFLCEDDAEAALYDPSRNPGIAQWLKELTVFTNDPSQIRLELLGEDQVRLQVSGEYLAFAEDHEIDTFLDFGWMKNAFIADYLAQVLLENGFTNGYLVSFDGFTRNLDARGNDYGMNLFDRRGGDLYAPASFHYSGPMSLVALRDHPLGDQDRWHYYAYETGEILTAFLDPADAMSKTSIPALVGYAADKGCGEILLELLDVFVADEFDPQTLGQTVDALWFAENTLYHTQDDAKVELLPNTGGLDYKIQ